MRLRINHQSATGADRAVPRHPDIHQAAATAAELALPLPMFNYAMMLKDNNSLAFFIGLLQHVLKPVDLALRKLTCPNLFRIGLIFFRFVGIQRHNPKSILRLCNIAQRFGIAHERIAVSKVLINFRKIFRQNILHRLGAVPDIFKRKRVVDIVISRNNINLDARIYKPLKLLSNLLVVQLLSVFC